MVFNYNTKGYPVNQLFSRAWQLRPGYPGLSTIPSEKLEAGPLAKPLPGAFFDWFVFLR